MTIRKRQKASDVFNKSEFLFPKTTFEKAFPGIAELSLDVAEFENFSGGDDPFSNPRAISRHSYSIQDPPGQYVNCSNPLCYNGGVGVGQILYSMTSKKQTEFSDSKFCRGYEGSPKGQKKYGECSHAFYIRVTIKYKASQTA